MYATSYYWTKGFSVTFRNVSRVQRGMTDTDVTVEISTAAVPEYSLQVLEDLELNAAEIIRALRKTPAGHPIEDVFSIEETSTDSELQLFRKLLVSLKYVCPDSDVDKFSSEFLHVIQQCQQKQVFRTLHIVFWIKFEGLVKHSQFRLRKLIRIQSKLPPASQLTLKQFKLQRRRKKIFGRIAKFLDKQLKKSFNPGNYLFTCERAVNVLQSYYCYPGWCLRIFTGIHEIYFFHVYRKSFMLRKLDTMKKAKKLLCVFCIYVLGTPIFILGIGGLIYHLVSKTTA